MSDARMSEVPGHHRNNATSARRAVVRAIMTLAPVALITTACDLFTNSEDDDQYTRTVNTFDGGGGFVAEFRFDQTGNRVDLTVTNKRVQSLCVPFRVDFVLNFASWQYQSSVSNLAPNASTSFNAIANNGARVDLAAIQVQFQAAPTTSC